MEQTNAPRRLAILPIENLAANPAMRVDAAAMQLAIWDSLQAQPSLHAVIAGHRRDLPELRPAYVVEGYVSDGRFQFQLNGQPISCAGTLADCVVNIINEIAKKVGITPRPTPKAASLRLVAGGSGPESLRMAAKVDSGFSAVWLKLSAQAQSEGGLGAGLAVLAEAPVETMQPYDAARIRLRSTELKQDRTAHAQALAALARTSPADIELQAQAAQETAAVRDFATAGQLFDQLIAKAPGSRFLNQAAYVATFAGDRAKAERYATAAMAAAPKDQRYLDTRAEIAYFFGDFAASSKYFEDVANLNIEFLGGQALWKGADAARMSGDSARAKTLLTRYIEFRLKTGLRNTLVLEALWDWSGTGQGAAIEKLRTDADSMERGKALFLLALMALNKRDFAAAKSYHLQLPSNSIEAMFLGSLMNGTALPPGFPFPEEAVAALRQHIRGANPAARKSWAIAKSKIDPFNEGQWRKFDAILNGQKPQGLLPASPDEWLAVLLR